MLAGNYGFSQAVINNFSPTVKGVTIGSVHCYFWSLPAPYDVEVACYQGTIPTIFAKSVGDKMVGSFPFVTGIITWILTPNGTLNHYDITGVGLDKKEVRITGDF